MNDTIRSIRVHPFGNTALWDVEVRMADGRSGAVIADRSKPVADPQRWHFSTRDMALTAARYFQAGTAVDIEVYDIDQFLVHTAMRQLPEPVERLRPVAEVAA